MASKVQESSTTGIAIDTQGYEGYGFGSFAANKLQQKPLQKKNKLLKQHSLRGIRERKLAAVSLPNIHISKLRENPPKRLTQSLKCDGKMLAHFDCKLCNDSTTKKRLIPSLIPSSMLPKLGGNRVYQASSGWGWSHREHMIKQTKFGVGDLSYPTIDGRCDVGRGRVQVQVITNALVI